MKREAQIEKNFIQKLQDLKYTYRPDIRTQQALDDHFREKFNQLNRVKLSDSEFARLLDNIITSDVFAAAKRLREIHTLIRDDNTPLNYSLVNLKDWCKNDFEIIHQLKMNTHKSHHRYDVLLLLNGVPVVQIELKDVIVSPRKAIEQIVQYKNDVGNGYNHSLLCFLQLFIVSNESNTFYFANNAKHHFKFNADERFLPVYQFAEPNNQKITHLTDFSEKLLAKCQLSELLSRYMVLVATEQRILVMRPYQVYAVKAILDCIEQQRGNGYIWHTTGSGKTLTSFKAATLLKENPHIQKCLFVVDRKDLDRQTREEFNRFQPNCVEQNTHTEKLVQNLLSDDYAHKVLVTTIQKLGLALDEPRQRKLHKKQLGFQSFTKRLAALSDKRMVIIFDECHRSQFGDNHDLIRKFFPKAQLFGFTGTPIFEKNARYEKYDRTQGMYVNTEDIFEQLLHQYTITDAIADNNVLKFHVDYYKPDGKNPPHFGEPMAQKAVAEAILAKHDAVTQQRRFNALLATASIQDAIHYYELFKTLQTNRLNENPQYVSLNIACVFSPPALETETQEQKKNQADVQQLQEDLPQERFDNLQNPLEKKAALTQILTDYNQLFGTHHSLNEFDKYYQDVQKRLKDQKYPNYELPHAQKIDILIVVDMLLTGFDSAYLNTLYVDKNLKFHGLIQAFSRTNRTLNALKPQGNILDFRGQEAAVDEAIQLFSGQEGTATQARTIWLVAELEVVLERYENAVQQLQQFMGQHGLACQPSAVHQLKGEAAKATFMNHFKAVQRLNTQLHQYTDLDDAHQAHLEQLLPEDQLRGFRGAYLETMQVLKPQQAVQNLLSEPQPLDFELVLFASAIIDYDYIIRLMAQNMGNPSRQNMTQQQIIDIIASDSKFTEDRADLTDYIHSLDWSKGQSEKAIRDGFQRFKAEKSDRLLDDLALKHDLPSRRLHAFVEAILNRLIFDGEKLTELLEPLGLGWKKRRLKELALMDDLVPALKKRADGREISGLSAYE